MFGFKIVRTKKINLAQECETVLEKRRDVQEWEVQELWGAIRSLRREVFGEAELYIAENPNRATLKERVDALTDGMEIKKVLVKKED